MANLRIEGEELVVELSMLEQLGAIATGVRVPLSEVTAVRTTDDPYAELRGIRVGTGLPYVIVLGRMVFPGGRDFVAIYGRRRRTVVIDLARGSGYQRLLLSSPDPAVVEALSRRAGVLHA